MFVWLNKTFSLSFVLLALLWLCQLNTLAVSMGLVAAVLAVFIWRRSRWAYFVAAAWCFGMLRLAMDKDNTLHTESLAAFKSALMAVYLLGIVGALVLHEKVAIKKSSADTGDSHGDQPPP